MATERRDIELAYRADLVQLKAELGKIPGVTDKEAKAMVKALDGQLKRAEKSARKAAAASRTGRRRASREAGQHGPPGIA